MQATSVMLFKKAEKRLDELYRQNQQGLYTVALAITKEEALAEDAVQTAFYKLYREPKPARNLKAYSFQMVRNAAIDQLRTASRFTGVEEVDIFASTESADENAATNEEKRLISAALGKLSEDQRETIVEHIYAGLTFREIAEVRGVPLATVGSWYRRGLQQLRAKLAGLGYE